MLERRYARESLDSQFSPVCSDAQTFKRHITMIYRKNVTPIHLMIGLAWTLTMLGYNFIRYVGAEEQVRRPYSMQIDSDPLSERCEWRLWE